MRLLLVEDDPALGEGIRDALLRAHYTVDWVSDGGHALQALLNEEFELAVLDLGLPSLDGSEVLGRCRARGVKTPILVLTARDAVPTASRASTAARTTI